MRTLAISTFDTAIADRQRADGGFGAPPSLDIQTMTFGNELGSAYLELESVLPAATKVRWQGAIAAAADYLVTNRNITWYTNGNINLGNTELFYLAWRATGDERYRLDYEQALSFTISPPQDRWSGYGLRILHQPTWADGADGTGYLAEAGTGGIGYDPEYTMLQLDVATRLYMQSGDSRILRLVNLFTNVLLPRVDASWMLDTSGGTRHTEQGRKVPFVTAALQVLATIGGRPELSPLASSQFGRVETEYSQAIGHVWPNISRGVAQQIAVDVQTTHPLANVSRTLLASKRVHRRQ